jgi:hypothetical protein
MFGCTVYRELNVLGIFPPTTVNDFNDQLIFYIGLQAEKNVTIINNTNI